MGSTCISVWYLRRSDSNQLQPIQSSEIGGGANEYRAQPESHSRSFRCTDSEPAMESHLIYECFELMCNLRDATRRDV